MGRPLGRRVTEISLDASGIRRYPKATDDTLIATVRTYVAHVRHVRYVDTMSVISPVRAHLIYVKR